MAEKLVIDNGLLELDINGNGLLRFNASDPNVYKRFYDLTKELPKIEERYKVEVEETGDEVEQAGAVLEKMYEIDGDVKQRLAVVFGGENDFDALMGGVNLMAFGGNGERVITNLLKALEPYMKSGMDKHMKATASQAVAEANKNRAQRRAGK